MDLKRLRSFVAVADSRSVSASSAGLGISQPALSRQLAGLAKTLGVELFESVGRRLALTAAGEELLGEARDLLARAELFRERARSLGRGDSGLLKVAASPQMIESAFPEFLALYAERQPQLRIKLIEAADAEQLVGLERGEVHLAINVAEADASRFAINLLPPMELLIAWHRSIGLERSSLIDVGALRGLPLLLLKPAFTTRKLFDAACRLAKFEPTVFVESAAPHTLMALAEAGMGAAIVPSTFQMGGRRLELAHLGYRGERLQIPLAIISDNRRNLPRYATEFIEGFTDFLRRIMPISGPTSRRGGGRSKTGRRKRMP
jgi:DNA-binding transcriptional LysR family regulator